MTALFCIGLFFVGIGGDYAWAKWTQASNNHRPFVAANWSFLIYCFSLAYTMAIIDSNWWLVGSFLAGSYIGTVVAVRK